MGSVIVVILFVGRGEGLFYLATCHYKYIVYIFLGTPKPEKKPKEKKLKKNETPSMKKVKNQLMRQQQQIQQQQQIPNTLKDLENPVRMPTCVNIKQLSKKLISAAVSSTSSLSSSSSPSSSMTSVSSGFVCGSGEIKTLTNQMTTERGCWNSGSSSTIASNSLNSGIVNTSSQQNSINKQQVYVNKSATASSTASSSSSGTPTQLTSLSLLTTPPSSTTTATVTTNNKSKVVVRGLTMGKINNSYFDNCPSLNSLVTETKTTNSCFTSK